MDRTVLLIVVLVLMLILGVMVRLRFLMHDAPFRQWWDARVGPLAGRVAKVFFLVTVIAWLVVWATASPEDRSRLGRDVQDFIQAHEWPSKAAPTKDKP